MHLSLPIKVTAFSLFLPSVHGHGLMRDPPSRNWVCGHDNKPWQVGNGIAAIPKCGEAYASSPIGEGGNSGGDSFMSVLTRKL
mmetsp:Transcript_34633/g.72080  ORF Transcript_34633/g.72080 Transcript_34633/m.72080 type:complete len:83 (+) Transcript_34633:66-314(+)